VKRGPSCFTFVLIADDPLSVFVAPRSTYPAIVTIIKTSTSYFACASPATTAANLSSTWFMPSN
jgi:hypothetical protein